jgi:hypothetical protein
MPDELLEPPEQPEDEEREPASAWDEVAYSVAEVIKRKEFREAAKKWVEAQADNVPKNHSYRVQQLWAGWCFSLIVFSAIVALGVYKVISPEVMVGLLGPMLGYWFGRKSAQ